MINNFSMPYTEGSVDYIFCFFYNEVNLTHQKCQLQIVYWCCIYFERSRFNHRRFVKQLHWKFDVHGPFAFRYYWDIFGILFKNYFLSYILVSIYYMKSSHQLKGSNFTNDAHLMFYSCFKYFQSLNMHISHCFKY